MAISLRALMEGRASGSFVAGGIADVEVPALQTDRRLAAIQRGLVAHDALSQLLRQVGAPPPDKLWDGISAAYDQKLITKKERNWLRFYNNEANRAKHDRLRF